MSKVEATFSADSVEQLVDQLRGFVAAHQPVVRIMGRETDFSSSADGKAEAKPAAAEAESPAAVEGRNYAWRAAEQRLRRMMHEHHNYLMPEPSPNTWATVAFDRTLERINAAFGTALQRIKTQENRADHFSQENIGLRERIAKLEAQVKEMAEAPGGCLTPAHVDEGRREAFHAARCIAVQAFGLIADLPYAWETAEQWFTRTVQRAVGDHRATVGRLEAEVAQVKAQADKLREHLEQLAGQKRSARGAMENALAVLDQ